MRVWGGLPKRARFGGVGERMGCGDKGWFGVVRRRIVAVGEVSSDERAMTDTGSGTSETEKLFCLMPFKPGERDL